MRTISPSQLRSMECRLQWYWAYPCGYKSNRLRPNLDLGTLVHWGLENHYRGEDPFKAMREWVDNKLPGLEWEDDQEALLDAHKLAEAMLEGYLQEYTEETFDVLHLESTVRRRLPMPYTDEKRFAMCMVVVRPDALVRDHKTGKLFSLQHKTFTRFSPQQLEVDPQFTAEIWVCQELPHALGLNEPVVGLIWNGLRKQAPGPRVKNKLFERHIVYRNEHQIQSFLTRLYHKHIETNRPNSMPIYAEPNHFRCAGCDFKLPCEEFQRGGDYKYILRTQYSKRGG
jgi:hypothetical protein